MKNIQAKFLLCSLLTTALVATIIPGCATSQAQLEARAKISRAEAEKIALAKVPGGIIKEGELEKEHGKLIWSFDIATPGSKDITEVHVDALTGAVIGMEKETPADQEREAKEKK